MADHVTNQTLVTGTSEGILPVDQLKVVERVHRKPMSLSSHEDGLNQDGDVFPTEDDYKTLRKVPVAMPASAYLICFMEFAERASYYGVSQVFKNFVRAPLPAGGNGAGAPTRGTQDTAGALGKGSAVSSAVDSSFKFLAYGLPIFGGWIADTHWGRFKTIWIGTAVFGLAHIIMVTAAIPSVLQAGNAMGPFLLSVYLLSIGAGLFKPCVAPILLDQNPLKRAVVRTNEDGERVIADPETTNESIMLWFYLLINVGAFFGIPTAYLAKYVGFWASFLLPGLVYFLLPPLLLYLKPRLHLQPPGGSDLTNIFKVVGIAIAKSGLGVFQKGGFNSAKPSVLAASGDTRIVPWNDQFVDDVTRTFQACGIFLFFPIFNINDGGLGAAANAQSAGLTSNGVPNDLISNLNPIAIIVTIPIVNHIVYPTLNRYHIRFGPVRRLTFGFFLCSFGSLGFSIIQHYIYKTSPCGNRASTCTDSEGNTLTSPLSLWLTAIPVVITAIAELFTNVVAYGIAYSRSPPNMKSLVVAINLFMTAISSAISLATTNVIQDPYLVWAFAGPSIIGFVFAAAFWLIYRDLDEEEYQVRSWEDDGPTEGVSVASDPDLTDNEKAKKSTHLL